MLFSFFKKEILKIFLLNLTSLTDKWVKIKKVLELIRHSENPNHHCKFDYQTELEFPT